MRCKLIGSFRSRCNYSSRDGNLTPASDNRILMPHFSNEDIRPVIRKPNEYKEAQLAKRTDKVRYVELRSNAA